jgi:hypothetical protein
MNFCISNKIYNCKYARGCNHNLSLLNNPDPINQLQQLVVHDNLHNIEAGSMTNSSASQSHLRIEFPILLLLIW